MKERFRLIKRGLRGGTIYCKDTVTGKRASLKTKNVDEALQIVQAKNQALRQPVLNLQIAKAYLAGSDSGATTRTWQHALDAIIEMKRGSTRERWERAARDKALDLIRNRPIVETQAENFLAVLKAGTISTNVHLRKLHSFCVDMNWLLAPVMPKRQWPAIHFKEKRAITLEEHERILAKEQNPELHAFYELCWHLGGAQSDIATLAAENIDWQERVIAFRRKKTAALSVLHFGGDVEAVLKRLPGAGLLFPRLAQVHEKHRAQEFRRRCRGLKIDGVTLHSYRYAWAQRAKVCGYPERFAQEALGHNSKAVHRACARGAQVKLPSLEDYEKAFAVSNVIPLHAQKGALEATAMATASKTGPAPSPLSLQA
jgi:integrase